MAAHLTKQIPAAPVVKASAALYWLPAFFLHLMVKANSLDEVFMHFLLYYRLMNLKLCKTDYWHRCRDLTRFFFFPSTFDECKRGSSRCFLLLL